tara:strand:+ start:81 stop:629 length:549 start_codon:yes stop_codon:yes gene_type:complete
MNWWEPWVNQGYNVLDVVNEAHAGNLNLEQYNALIGWIVEGFGEFAETDVETYFSGVEGDFSTEDQFTESAWQSHLDDYQAETETEQGILGDFTPEELSAQGAFYHGYQPHFQYSPSFYGFGNYQSAQDWAGGGGVAGERAKSLFYPDQQTGFAGVGKGIGNQSYGGPMKSTLDELLKNQDR